MEKIVEMYTPVPKLKNRWQKIWQKLLGTFLAYGYIIIALIVWVYANWYIAVSILFLAYIVIGIISSKIVHYSIPPLQREFNYTPFEIASWYIHDICIVIEDDESL